MIKKVFKAMRLGMRETIPSLVESLVELLIIFAVKFWLPILMWCTLSLFNIHFDTETWLALILFTAIIGITIVLFIVHCIEAIQYQEKEHCSFHEAWEATNKINLEEDELF